MSAQNIAAASPAEIDAELSKLSYDHAVLQQRGAQYQKAADKAAEGNRWESPNPEKAAEFEAAAQGFFAQAAELELAMAPLNDEFQARGGWTRAFLVTNSGGHVHSSMGCSTCFPTTSYHWVTDFSGHDEDEIVEAAGERACTVCYPSAPVEILNRPTQMFTPDEVRKAAERAEREIKRNAKDALKVFDPITGAELYKTEKAAELAVAHNMGSIRDYEYDHPSLPEWEAVADAAVRALAAKRDVDPAALRAEFEAKADKSYAARIRKNWRELKADCASGRWTRSMVNFDAPTVRYGKSIGEELVFSRED